jgi:hypothetical protein
VSNKLDKYNRALLMEFLQVMRRRVAVQCIALRAGGDLLCMKNSHRNLIDWAASLAEMQLFGCSKIGSRNLGFYKIANSDRISEVMYASSCMLPSVIGGPSGWLVVNRSPRRRGRATTAVLRARAPWQP